MKHFKNIDLTELKNRKMPLHFTLLCYFLLFGFIILIVLWVFQSFFLESFYTSTKKRSVEKSAKIIAESLENNTNPLATIENVASYNSLSVQVYDTSTAFFQKRYECNYASPSVSVNIVFLKNTKKILPQTIPQINLIGRKNIVILPRL